jgi:hypothetical protein
MLARLQDGRIESTSDGLPWGDARSNLPQRPVSASTNFEQGLRGCVEFHGRSLSDGLVDAVRGT